MSSKKLFFLNFLFLIKFYGEHPVDEMWIKKQSADFKGYPDRLRSVAEEPVSEFL
jgi:hypothetical protein